MKKILVIGSLNMDFVFKLHHMPARGETVIAGDSEFIPGGKGANQAYAAGKFRGQVTMLGAVGNDENGREICRNLSSVGVDVSHIKISEKLSTATALVGVDEQGNNSIIVLSGANSLVDTAYIREKQFLIEESDIIVLQLEIPLDTVLYAAKTAKQMGKTVILDPAPARSDLPGELYGYIDILKPNEGEIRTLLEDELADRRLRQSCQKLVAMGVGNVVVTLGGNGSYLYQNDGTQERFPADQSVKVVDTTAAGDSFTAAIAAALAQGKSLSEAVRFASKISDIVVTRKGAQTSIPFPEEIQ